MELKQRENEILAKSRIEAGKDTELRLFRNNTGSLFDEKSNRMVTFGLCPGSSDLIGWRSVVITPEMVGKRVAIFIGAECKAPYSYASTPQRQFIQVVRDMGGRAGIFRNPDELIALTLGH